jgi:hypothetical protein
MVDRANSDVSRRQTTGLQSACAPYVVLDRRSHSRSTLGRPPLGIHFNNEVLYVGVPTF